MSLFKKCNAYLPNKSINFFKKNNLTYPNLWTVVYYVKSSLNMYVVFFSSKLILFSGYLDIFSGKQVKNTD